jgi:predicted TIM-barrel fold metal-dependent hydrolase
VEGTTPTTPGVIDVHLHVVRANLPDELGKQTADETPFETSLEQQAKVVQAELKRANIVHALCMPRRDLGKTDPLGVEDTRRMAKLVPGLHPIGLADPERADEEHLARVEQTLAQGDVVGFKAYLGYLHFPPDHPGYVPYYRLAAKYKIPVIFHTGDTYSHVARLKYAHPLPLDDMAVDFPETNFVLAHIGNPWLMDAAELIYKNNKPGFRENVWADLSGLLVGTAEQFEAYRRQGALASVIEQVRKAIEFAERPDRFLFGSDWPLAPIDTYLNFIRDLVPAEHHQAVFHDNAKALFRLA